ncbi:hypothetical protein E2C01_012677 [Portunus trituberculatus]|uniref:Uncharacterized protein n=1 Tax=Portunus trituberculatus TaxID=210409 RepID=A0A5B7DER4_PORTR|nr:hypothetical protein [Portunus trituberculatus]
MEQLVQDFRPYAHTPQPPMGLASGVSKSPSAPCATQQQCKTMGQARTMLPSRRGTIGLAGRPGEGLALGGISGTRGSGVTKGSRRSSKFARWVQQESFQGLRLGPEERLLLQLVLRSRRIVIKTGSLSQTVVEPRRPDSMVIVPGSRDE